MRVPTRETPDSHPDEAEVPPPRATVTENAQPLALGEPAYRERDSAARRVRVAVVLAQPPLAPAATVATSCATLGFGHELTLDSIGVLIGSIESSRLSALLDVEGVSAVEVEHATSFHLPPDAGA